MRFPADRTRLASVRDFAVEAVEQLGSPVDLDALAVIVGELAANAVEHQSGDAELVVRVHPGGAVDIEVQDSDDTIPEAIDGDPHDPDGHRGLVLVRTLSDSWGVRPEPPGKRVWARLAPPPTRPG